MADISKEQKDLFFKSFINASALADRTVAMLDKGQNIHARASALATKKALDAMMRAILGV